MISNERRTPAPLIPPDAPDDVIDAAGDPVWSDPRNPYTVVLAVAAAVALIVTIGFLMAHVDPTMSEAARGQAGVTVVAVSYFVVLVVAVGRRRYRDRRATVLGFIPQDGPRDDPE